MIDTHAHLYAEQFSNDIDQVLNRAFENGISKIFLPNIDVESIEGLNNLRDAHPESIYGMMGLHPCSVSEDYKEELKTLKKTLYDGNYIAVGEIGIDLYWDKSTLPLQQEAFIEQCNWAIELGLPIAIHSRESNNEILDILENEFKGRITGVFHCFSGNETKNSTFIHYYTHSISMVSIWKFIRTRKFDFTTKSNNSYKISRNYWTFCWN